MSLDKIRSRKDYDTEISKREKDQAKRLKDSMKVVKDKKTEADTSKSLRQRGTAEGINAVKKAVKAAAAETEEEFKTQETDLKKKILDKAKKTEKELLQRSGETKKDLTKIRKAISQIDTKKAAAQMKDAGKQAEDDRGFLDKSKQKQETDRKKGEAKIKDQGQQLRRAKIRFQR